MKGKAIKNCVLFEIENETKALFLVASAFVFLICGGINESAIYSTIYTRVVYVRKGPREQGSLALRTYVRAGERVEIERESCPRPCLTPPQ